MTAVPLDPHQREAAKTTEGPLQAALGQVVRYVERVRATRPDWSHIEQAEVDMSLVKDAYILQGTVDLVQGADGTVEGFDGVVERIERREFGVAEWPTKLCENCDMNAYCDRRG